jgi:ppGpp synthetase/RelA/SpoT-type nucleotidyltranferase
LWVVEDFRRWHQPVVGQIHSRLIAEWHEHAGLTQEEVPVTSRPKTPDSIVAKLCRSSTSLIRMQDIAGARIVVPTLSTQDSVLRATLTALKAWSPRVDDQRDMPAEYSYRAVHVIVQIPDEFFPDDSHWAEIQIRTRRQDLWAQIVERLDKDRGWDLKHGSGPAEWLEWLHDLSDELRKADFGETWVIPPSPYDRGVE